MSFVTHSYCLDYTMIFVEKSTNETPRLKPSFGVIYLYVRRKRNDSSSGKDSGSSKLFNTLIQAGVEFFNSSDYC